MLVLEGKVYLRGELNDCSVGIEDGRIVEIRKSIRGDEHKNYGERLLLPGGIDIHVHFRDPGMTHKEDFRTGSVSAGMGGVTTVFDMPNTSPPTITLDNYNEKVRIAKNKSLVDFGIYGGLFKPNEVNRLAKVAPALKLYLAPTTGGLDVSTDDIPEMLSNVPDDNPPIIVHAEDPTKFESRKANTLIEQNLTRPIDSESSSILALKDIKKQLHITHITSVEGLKVAESVEFTKDATPHHLLLDCKNPLGQRGKVNPPLREPADRDELWKAFIDGRIDILASDHAPHTSEEKEVNFSDAPPGLPGVETMLPLLLRRVRSWDLTMQRLLNAVSEKPARLIGLRKGSIEVGMDADIIVVDLREVRKVRGKNLHSKCDWTAFENWEAIFPHAVYLRGNLIVDGGELVENYAGLPVKCFPEIRSRKITPSFEKEKKSS